MTREKNSNHSDFDFEVAIMRLVDNEMPADDRRELLKQLEAQPDGWRACALAFVEDQAMRRALKSSREKSTATTGAALTSGSTQPAAVAPHAGHTRHPDDSKRPVRQAPMSWGQLFATAATILCAFGVGWLGSRSRLPATPAIGTIGESRPMTIQPSVVARKNNGSPDVVTNPAYVVAPEFWNQDSMVPRDLRRSLESNGTRLQTRRGFFPTQSPDGHPVLVPYEDVEIVPVRSSY